LENGELVTERENLRLQGGTGSKTGGNQSEKGDEKRAHRDTTRISRMLGTSAFSARTEFSVTTTSPFQKIPTPTPGFGAKLQVACREFASALSPKKISENLEIRKNKKPASSAKSGSRRQARLGGAQPSPACRTSGARRIWEMKSRGHLTLI
jgi:hypothetical protein